jgi:hypothetical protein
MITCASLAFILATYGWNMVRVVLNWAIIPLKPKSKLMCLFFSTRAIQIHLDMNALVNAEQTLQQRKEAKSETEGAVDEKTPVHLRSVNYKQSLDHTAD